MSRLQELNAYLEEIPPDIEGQEIPTLPVDKIMGIIYHYMLSTWNNKMIEQGFNYADSTNKEKTIFFKTRVENLEPKENKKKYSSAIRKNKKSHRKRKKEYSDFSVVESSEESTEARRLHKKYCILHGKCSHFSYAEDGPS